MAPSGFIISKEEQSNFVKSRLSAICIFERYRKEVLNRKRQPGNATQYWSGKRGASTPAEPSSTGTQIAAMDENLLMPLTRETVAEDVENVPKETSEGYHETKVDDREHIKISSWPHIGPLEPIHNSQDGFSLPSHNWRLRGNEDDSEAVPAQEPGQYPNEGIGYPLQRTTSRLGIDHDSECRETEAANQGTSSVSNEDEDLGCAFSKIPGELVGDEDDSSLTNDPDQSSKRGYALEASNASVVGMLEQESSRSMDEGFAMSVTQRQNPREN